MRQIIHFATRKYLEGAWLNNSSVQPSKFVISITALRSETITTALDWIKDPGIAFSWIFTCTIKTALFCSKRKDPEPCL
ncbi:unnamed protein product [Rhizophagus irregularis]|uniref:Uncharacterized protein n=1 Tax=Rhizophagus irregularis TaxID=588596 RepID=A0A915Z5T0_9GLOM|nr:unnamed protein product [Rhizophagus irregularis]CAB5361795.1 unnamed protein product [Rhizophagus irregularis]